MKDKSKLVKEFILFLIAVVILCWLTPKVLLSSEDKMSQYVACSQYGGLDNYSHFSSTVKCVDGSNQSWK